MYGLFDEFAPQTAERLGCHYNSEEAANSRAWLEKVRNYPKE